MFPLGDSVAHAVCGPFYLGFFFFALCSSWETLDAEKNKSEKKSNAEEKSKDE